MVNKKTIKYINPFTKFLYKLSTKSDCFNFSPLILPSFATFAKKNLLKSYFTALAAALSAAVVVVA